MSRYIARLLYREWVLQIRHPRMLSDIDSQRMVLRVEPGNGTPTAASHYRLEYCGFLFSYWYRQHSLFAGSLPHKPIDRTALL